MASEFHSKKQYSKVQKIPIRATVISALSVVPQLIVITAENASGLAKEDIGMGNRLVMLLFSLIRCPLIGNNGTLCHKFDSYFWVLFLFPRVNKKLYE